VHRNNLDAIRIVAAFLVVFGHSYALKGLPEHHFLSWLPLGPLGVYIFFTISGYLVIESWRRDPHAVRFFARRALRIFPALAVCTVLTVFVLGPLVTTRPLREYFASPFTYGYLENIALYIHFYLPGVFEHTPVPNAVNGSLWSLPVEFFMYIALAVVGLLRGNRWAFAALAAVSVGLAVGWAHTATEMIVVYATDLRQVVLCGTFFWMGALVREFRLERYFSLSTVVMACVAMVSLEPWTATLRAASWVLLPTVVLGFGLARSQPLLWLTRTGDYSYGVYIYAFPIQQTLVFLNPRISVERLILLSTLITLVCAVISWHLVERPALRLKPRSEGRADRRSVVGSVVSEVAP
jgi:peptidoglycan/LPS O-acetylase OafA/YrhL